MFTPGVMTLGMSYTNKDFPTTLTESFQIYGKFGDGSTSGLYRYTCGSQVKEHIKCDYIHARELQVNLPIQHNVSRHVYLSYPEEFCPCIFDDPVLPRQLGLSPRQSIVLIAITIWFVIAIGFFTERILPHFFIRS